ncbi:glycosyltransferase family 9 protein [Methylocaldum szegediense]|uniref:ADP-heptose:LPS heptosyltransferase n=1 Tax=Methylocaldum szegediense TaxID=73780 RepID=A0ABM9I1S9_9GAMM|nr:glycosyltransferase family 9 protein [Methylocaldum szegediense]CAI8832557.1 ADP-heptose:LPS heptosyltransferase [Methylocaldum szegediense]
MQARWWRRFKRAVEFFIFGLFDRVALVGRKNQPDQRRIALVHVQLLGDAFLWLPYAQAMVSTLVLRGQVPVIVCEAAVRPVLATGLSGCEIVAINKRDFLRCAPCRWRILRGLRDLQASHTYLCSHPRDGITQDAIVRALGAPATGFWDTYADRPAIDRWMGNRLYHNLIKVEAGGIQTHHRALLKATGFGEVAVMPVAFPNQPTSPCPDPYWVLSPGASREFRRWPEDRYAEVAACVAERFPQLRCVILGSAAECALGERIASILGERVLNLVGKTSVTELIRWITHAKLVVGNDSAAGHIAAGVGIPSVIVVGGGHWGRCYPYPKEAPVRCLPTVVGRSMECFGCDWQCIHTARTDRPFPCIEQVPAEDVIRAVDTMLSAASVPGATSDAPPLQQGLQGHQATAP